MYPSAFVFRPLKPGSSGICFSHNFRFVLIPIQRRHELYPLLVQSSSINIGTMSRNQRVLASGACVNVNVGCDTTIRMSSGISSSLDSRFPLSTSSLYCFAIPQCKWLRDCGNSNWSVKYKRRTIFVIRSQLTRRNSAISRTGRNPSHEDTH